MLDQGQMNSNEFIYSARGSEAEIIIILILLIQLNDIELRVVLCGWCNQQLSVEMCGY